MARTNGFFGMIQGPFLSGQQIIKKIQLDCVYPINYITKIGIHYLGDLVQGYQPNGKTAPFSIFLNNIQFIIGKAKQLELEDTQITSIKFSHDTTKDVIIDYQYQ